MESESDTKAYKDLLFMYKTAIQNGFVEAKRNPILYIIASTELEAKK